MKKITKLLALMFCIVLTVGVLTATASAAEVIHSGSGDTIKWELTSDGTLTISGTGRMGSFSELPDRPAAWRYAGIIENIKKVVICDGVTSIGEFAFYECENLEAVEIADSVTEIGRGAFMGCKLLTSAEIPEGVAAIASNAFAYCSSLKSVVLHEGLASIGDAAFWYCKSLESINFPEGLETIDRHAFGYCTSLAEVNIPSSLKTIGYESDFAFAFPGCPISRITVDSGNEYYSTDESCQVLFNKDKTVLLYAVKSLAGEYTVPAGVGTISHGAFTNCDKLTKIPLPEGISDITESAFAGCTLLESIVIPESVTEIGFYAFADCTGLKSISLPKNLVYLPGSAFMNCSSIETITIPKAVEYVESSAFEGCTSLKYIAIDPENENCSVDENGVLFNKDKTALIAVPGGLSGDYTIPDSVKEIYDSSFNDCHSITSIVIPASAKFGYEEDYPTNYYNLCRCYNLKRITVDETNPYYTSDENGVLYNKDKSVLLLVPGGYEGTFTIPASVERIDGNAFGSCSKLTGIISESKNYCTDEYGVLYDSDKTSLIKAPVTLIGEYEIPDPVKSIANGAFMNCSSLESVSIPPISFFYTNAFVGCTELKSITFLGSKPVFITKSGTAIEDFAGTVFYPAEDGSWSSEIGYDITGISLIPYDDPGGAVVKTRLLLARRIVLGDVNVDGELTNADLILVARYVVRLIDVFTPGYINVVRFGDMNADGNINNADIIIIARAIVRL